MSPASKSRTKDKSTPKAFKEQSKVSIKPSHVQLNGGSSSTASAYNPILGTFHSLEISSPSLTIPQSNGRYRSIDDPEDHSGNSPGTTAEYDSLSNNDSCSGESEDQREKLTTAAPRTETIPGCDNEKRDKIRQKNEKKHQRQKERRAQELHERCTAFLTSRKLESLSHQLVAMGFPSDRATMAIITNEGRMEESVAWLLHEIEEDIKQQKSVTIEDKSRLKIDIADELARIAGMEVKFKCSKQDVERAVVACDGDLLKAEDNLRAQKQAISSTASFKSDESVDSIGLNDKMATMNQIPMSIKTPIKGSVTVHHQRRDERDANYRTLVSGTLLQDSSNGNIQLPITRMQPKATEWARGQVAAVDKRWLTMSNTSPVSYPLASPVQFSEPAARSEPQFGAIVGREVKTRFQAGALKEPLVVMRGPKKNLPSSTIGMSVSPPASTLWYSGDIPSMEILTAANGGLGHSRAGMCTNESALRQFYPQNSVQPMPSGPSERSSSAGWSNHSWNGSGATSSSLAVPSSLGLFTGWGMPGAGSFSQNDWNTSGPTRNRDYTSIDWSLDLTPPLRPSLKNEMASDTWSTMFMGGNATRPLVNGGSGGLLGDPSAPVTSQEWTNPFEGRDLFRAPRQYVTSPFL